MLRRAPKAIAKQVETAEICLIENHAQPIVCLFLTPKLPALSLGKPAVASPFCSIGLVQRLLTNAENRTHRPGLATLEL